MGNGWHSSLVKAWGKERGEGDGGERERESVERGRERGRERPAAREEDEGR